MLWSLARDFLERIGSIGRLSQVARAYHRAPNWKGPSIFWVETGAEWVSPKLPVVPIYTRVSTDAGWTRSSIPWTSTRGR